MDSQLASVLTSGSLDVQNGSQSAEGSGPVTEAFLEAQDKTSLSTVPGNLQPCPVKAAVAIITQDAPSVNGKKPEVGGNSKPASQEISKIGGFRQPITVKTGVPVLRSQPIRIKIVVPPRCKRPITNSAISLTKDFARSHFRRPVLVSAGAVITDRNRSKIQIPAVKTEGGDATQINTEESKAVSLHGAEVERGETMCKETEVLDSESVHAALISNTNAVQVTSQRGIKEETQKNVPLILQEVDLKPCETLGEAGTEEQTEPLDLSLPKKPESQERRCARFLDDSCCETSLIMEVDEYEGEGDRDIVEEDDGDGGDVLDDSLLSPSFFSTSVLTSLSSLDVDTEDLLLIDDQGIPYTLGPDGLKVPQVQASTSDDPQQGQADSAEADGEGSSRSADASLSQSFDNALHAPSDDLHSSPAPAAESPPPAADQTTAPDVLMSSLTNSDPSKAAEPDMKAVQEANAVVAPPSGMSAPSQSIQLIANPPASAPIILLSSPSPSPQLSLPLSVTQTSPGASGPMFLLLSSVASSSADAASTSTPIAVLDPSTGQLSQITAALAALSLPLSSAQPSAVVPPPLPALSHPVIRLSASDTPVILSGVNHVNAGSVLTSLALPASAPCLQSDRSITPIIQTQISSSDSKPGSEAIPAEEVCSDNNKPSASPHPQSASSAQPSPEAEAQSPASEPKFDPSDLHSEHLPLDDHLYFSNTAAPPSPPIGPLLPSSGKLEPLDPLDPLSPAESPNTMGSRRVLYCQLCPRVFFYLSDLERHAITHSQKKPHVCQQCGKAFKRSSHLQVSAGSFH